MKNPPAQSLLLTALLLLPIACSGTEIVTSPMPTPNHTTESTNSALPAIDVEAPSEYQTATFALG